MRAKIFIVILCAAVLCAARAAAEVDEVYLTPHFHYDPVFQEDQNDYTDVGFDRCRRFMDALAVDPDYAVVFSEIDYLKPYFDTFPEQRDTLLKHISENRIETGGSYSEPNEMSIGGEGLIRNILYGRAYHEGVLGDRRAGVYMPFDVFGHTLQLTQVLAKTRYKGCVWRKGNPPTEKWVNVTVPGLPPDFVNLAPDGSTLHHRREHYKAVSGTTSEEDLISKVEGKIMIQNYLGPHADFALLSSADFAYPEPWLAGHCTALKQHTPPIYISGPSAYFDAIKQQTDSGELDLPVVARDFSLYHTGTALSRVNLKIGNRLVENLALDAEKFGTVAALLGARYPEPALDKAWRQLLFNQHHDGITGTHNDRSYFDLMAGFREAADLSLAARTGALTFIVSKIDTSGKDASAIPIVVFNPLGWPRTDVVTTPWMDAAPGHLVVLDAQGQEVPYEVTDTGPEVNGAPRVRLSFTARDIPSMGYKTWHITMDSSGQPAPAFQPSNKTTIQNEFYSVTVDPARGGTITAIKDLSSGMAVVSPDTEFPGNELIVLQEDKGPQYPAWELSTTGVKDMSSKHAAIVNSFENDAMQLFTVIGELPGLGRYEQEIRLYNGVKRIDFVTRIDPVTGEDENDRNLWMVRFPAKLHGTAPVVEDRFFAAARRRSLEPLSYRTDLDKMLTLSAPYAADRWVEEGVAVHIDILDDQGRTIDAQALQLCEIVYADNPASRDAARALQRALITRGVACTPSLAGENRKADLLNRNFRFVIDIAGDNKFAKSLLKKSEHAEAFKTRLAADGTARLLMAAPTGDKDIPAVDTLVLAAADASAMAALVQDMEQSILADTKIRIRDFEDVRGATPAAPHDYGIALINRGTLLHSFDNNGTIVMGLFHSAQWARDKMGVPFSFPEQKKHQFTYSLYPHSGDWRAADTWRAGHEVNTPLIAVAPPGRPGKDLPPAMSFVDVQAQSTALSAFKSAGNPLAHMKTAAAPGPHNGAVLRLYETEGRPDTVTVKFFRPVSAAWFANMLEEKDPARPVQVLNGDTLTFDMDPNAIETLFVEFKDAAPPAADAPALAPETEPSGVLYSNYWDYNLGAAYMNNSPVSVTLDFPLEKELPDPRMLEMGAVKVAEKKFRKGENALRLSISNNSADEPLAGELVVETPEGWTAEPAHLSLDMAPLEGRLVDLKVNATKPVEFGVVRAAIKTDEAEYFDVLPTGRTPELEAEAEITRHQWAGDYLLTVRIRNNRGVLIQGMAEPVGPVETWPEQAAGDMSLVQLQDRVKYFELEPDAETALEFPISNQSQNRGNRFWFMVRVFFNGEYKYIPVQYRDKE